MKRRISAYLATATLLLLVVAPLWLVSTAGGLRWALQFAQEKLPISTQGADGSLWRGVSFKNFRYADNTLSIDLKDVHLRLAWGCVFRSTLCVHEASAQTVTVALPDAGPTPKTDPGLTPPLPWVPLLLDVTSLRIAHLELQNGDRSEVFKGVFLSGEVGRDRLLLAEFAGEHAWLNWLGGGSLGRNGRWDLAFDLALASNAIPGLPGELEDAYALKLSGDLGGLQGTLQALAGSPVVSLAVQRESSGRISVEGSLENYLDTLQTLIPEVRDFEGLDAESPLGFQAEVKDAKNLTVSVEQSLAGLSQEVLDLQVNLEQTSGRWTLTRATAGSNAKTLLSVSGPLGEVSDLRPTLQFDATQFPVPLPSEHPRIMLSGSGEIAFSLQDPSRTFAVTTPGLDIQADDTSWLLSGDIQATDVALLPSGSISGVFGDLPFAYARASTPGAPARLSLPEGIPMEGLVISKVHAMLVPGESTQLKVVSEGELRGDVDLVLAKTDKGASFLIDPFVVFLRDEAIRSDEAVRGEWIAEASALLLEDFCLAWRRSSACGGHARLGQSGTLGLALTIDESVQGAVSQKPFSFQAQGTGELQLEWLAGALVDAKFDVDFNSLALDPYMYKGTASPIRWERARASGSVRPNSRQLSVALVSERVGALSLTLDEKGEELGGSLQARAIDLAALDDLLPEWTLRSGTVEADLSLSGSRSSPQLFGRLVLDHAAAQHPDIESGLSDLRVVLDAKGEGFTLDATSLLGGAPLTLTGACCDDASLIAQLEGDKNLLRIPPIGVDATISPRLDMQLSQQSLSVGGEVVVHGGVLQHAGPTEDAIALSDDVYRIDEPEESPRRFDVDVDIRALIEPGFTLRSKELEATLAGDVTVNLQPEVPAALYGDLQVLGGELRAYGQVLRLTEGSVGFVGDPVNPALNLSAERRIRAEDLRVGFHVRGNLEEPVFEMFSDPVRSERDTLSYLLRGRGPDAGASVDGTAMALSLGASAINQSGALESLNAIPGLSGVSLGAEGSDDDMAATISAYVGERLYLSYGVGIYEPVNALTARLYLRSRLWLEVVSRLESSFDLYYRFDIE